MKTFFVSLFTGYSISLFLSPYLSLFIPSYTLTIALIICSFIYFSKVSATGWKTTPIIIASASPIAYALSHFNRYLPFGDELLYPEEILTGMILFVVVLLLFNSNDRKRLAYSSVFISIGFWLTIMQAVTEFFSLHYFLFMVPLFIAFGALAFAEKETPPMLNGLFGTSFLIYGVSFLLIKIQDVLTFAECLLLFSSFSHLLMVALSPIKPTSTERGNFTYKDYATGYALTDSPSSTTSGSYEGPPLTANIGTLMHDRMDEYQFRAQTQEQRQRQYDMEYGHLTSNHRRKIVDQIEQSWTDKTYDYDDE